MSEGKGRPHIEASSEVGKKEGHTIDSTLFAQLNPEQAYTSEFLEEFFGVKFSEGLGKLLQEKSRWDDVGEGKFRFVGTIKDLDKRVLGRQKKHDIGTAAKRIPQNLEKVVINQTYSAEDLAQIFNIRIEDNLAKYLKRYLQIHKLPDGNYKVLKFLSPIESAEENELGYNPLVQEVFDSLKEKYNNEAFMLRILDIPLELRKKMAPGLLPRIFEYLIDSGVFEEVRPKWYHIAGEFQLKNK